MKKYVLIFLVCISSLSQTSYWSTINLNTSYDLYSVYGKYIVGNNGTIFYSSNGGLNWTQQQSNTTLGLKSVASFIPNEVVLVAGDNGVILKTSNNGTNWTIIPTGFNQNLKSIRYAAFNFCYAAGDNGTLLRSTNSGANWILMNSGTSQNLKSVYVNNGKIWICGANGTVLFLQNVLDTICHVSNINTNVSINSLNYYNSLFAVGDNGVIFNSTDDGVSWQSMQSNTSSNLQGITNGWVVGNNGTILNYSNNSWNNNPGITTSDLLSIYYGGTVLGNPYLFSVGKNGTLLTLRSDTSYFYYHLAGNNIRSWFSAGGIFDQDLRTANTPGFEWPIGTGRNAIFTTGLTIAGYVNNTLRMAAASYRGEYLLGYCSNGAYITNNTFKYYMVKRGDNQNTNRDWATWGLMVPYGAPYKDVNNNGTYEPEIDIPGIKDASQTLFVCLTDANPASHSLSEGFGGGTLPLGAELHLTAWCYDNPGYQDMQFIKWDVINKSNKIWDSVIFSNVTDPDLGDAVDDYIGCDTIRNLTYCYNADNQDGNGNPPSYGLNPPAVGFRYLNCSINNALRISSMTYFMGTGAGGPTCENDPSQNYHAYNFMKGLKRDGTPWVIPNTNPPQTTKYVYSGDPESNTGWTEYQGRVENCGGSLTGTLVSPCPPGDRRFIPSYKPLQNFVNPGDTQKIIMCQLIARGSNHRNSVTLLKQLSDVAQQLCENGFVIGITPISNEIPKQFSLEQNYPNPFNPITNIKFSIPKSAKVKLTIYDALGREVATLVNEKLNTGTYNARWDGTNFASGIYFYKIEARQGDGSSTDDFVDTKKMVLIK